MKRKISFTHYETTVGAGKRKQSVKLNARQSDIAAARAEAASHGGRRITPRYNR